MGSKMPKTRKRMRVMLKKLFDLTQFAIGKKSVKYTVKVSARVFWVLLCYFHVLEGAILFLSGTFRYFWVS